MIISIEGNIGSGKTTLLSMVRERLGDEVEDGRPVVFVGEPVSEWESIKDDDGKSMLDLLYSDAKTHSFAFQMMAFITRFNAIRNAHKENPDAILIMERCLQTDAEVFAKMLRNSGDILPVHYKIYEKWANELSADYHPDLVIYARADPAKSLERVVKRGRKSEEGMTLDYLTRCHNRHEEWIVENVDRSVKIVFDANEEFVGDKSYRVDDLIKEIHSRM